ncbi:MAG: nucleotide exchange factor GrpE [Candidatus Diapherotrites archaeon]
MFGKEQEQKGREEKKSKKEGLEKELLETKAKLQEYTESLQRLQAEFENFKKRIEKEKKEFMEYSNAGLIAKILPVIDSIDAAVKHFKETGNTKKEDFIKGIELIRKQLMETLEKEGLKEIKSKEEKFDPLYHEAMICCEDKEKENHKIIEELQKGYMLWEKVLRHSKVKINKLKEEKEIEKEKIVEGGKQNGSKEESKNSKT